jgi:hypothetical protein
MGEEAAPGNAVFGFAHSLLQNAVLVTGLQGVNGGFWQVFDVDPDDEDVEPEVHREQLDRGAARGLIQRRKEAGFDGLCGFCCFESNDMRLYVEAFDVRRVKSISLGGPLRKTIFGRYRPAGGSAQILGIPTI